MKIFGIPVKIDVSFFVLTLFLAYGRVGEPLLIVEWVGIVFFSILLHELGHALAARFFGLSPSILLYSLGGLTSFSQGKNLTPLKNLVIGLSGPAAGFLLGGLVFWSRAVFIGEQNSRILFQAYYDLLWVNIGWGIFNLLPIVPLDGGNFLTTLETWFSRKTDLIISRIISLLTATAIICWALYIHSPWIAFLGIWFVYINGSVLVQKLQKHREQKLRPFVEEAREAIARGEFDSALTLLGKLRDEAKTTETRREVAQLVIFTYIQAGGYEEAEKELEHFHVLFGADAYLDGLLLFKKGLLPQTIAHLRTAFEAAPSKEVGLVLYQALVKNGDLEEAFELCPHSVMSDVAWSLYAHLQSEAFNEGKFNLSARAGRLAYELQRDANVAYNVACAYARDAKLEEGIEWLESAANSGFANRETLASDSDIDLLRASTEFEQIKRRIIDNG
jgi:Zn-dependent protease